MTRYRSHTIGSTREYVDFIRRNFKAQDMLFRGQPEDKPLLPRIARLQLRDAIPDVERKMIHEFKRRAHRLMDVRPDSNWDWLAIAQHYGMPTRLLDWTTDPLAALWFAVNRPPGKRGAKSQPGVVWVLLPKPTDYAGATDPFTIGRTGIFRPKHIAARLITRLGSFTAHKFTTTARRFVPFEESPAYSKKLTKLRIRPESFSEIRSEIDRLDVNAATLFPGVDGLCAHIQWANSYPDDEK
jgi:hypothetical protein